jgi:hypothetical protein
MAHIIRPTREQMLAFCREDPVERVFLEDVARRGSGSFVGLGAGGPLVALGAAYGLGLLPILFGMSYLSSWFLGLFALGMIAAAINVAPSPAFRWLRSRAPWGWR